MANEPIKDKIEIPLFVSDVVASAPSPGDFIRLNDNGDLVVMDVGFVVRDAQQNPVKACVTHRFHLPRSLVENLKNNMLSGGIPIVMSTNTPPGERS